MGRLWYRWPLALYDRAYRWAYGLDQSTARIGPLICLAQQRGRSVVVLADGTVLRPGDAIGVIHLDNAAVVALHADGLGPLARGLEFRRQLVASLRELAVLASPEGRLEHLQAFAAVTIFGGLRRLGFQHTPGPVFPRIVAAYQRALLSHLHPAGRLWSETGAHPSAYRLVISRGKLLTRYGQAPARRAAIGALSGSPRRACEPP